MAEIPFPGGATDGTTFFHEDKVCVYHAATNTWECRTISSETPQPPTTVYTSDVYVPDGFRQLWQGKVDANNISFTVPAVTTAQEVNQALIDFITAIPHASSPDLTEFITGTVLETRLSGLATANDFTALAATISAAVNLQAQNQANHIAAVDAKFDQLRAAVNESTDFNTLKARLLAVLQ